ncbi:SAM-dependent methyltransferase [Spongiactinospora sp. TRM90649]|uniref:SAM-dependent methyltransferase n=1 Tax=Spongiactinospora sp. TRM90649 TaxID=3031114 RepID=UPI0023F86215|nr:SAM-dependent methyltransferase [Spongiactinospora sp. TRM90649]MDF5751864.1 SAM-dependent methyltransferase [Spongiactinospora sp. TRM90649]
MGVNLRTNVPHSARVYDYFLGGKDNFEADRTAAEEVIKIAPYMPTSVRANRDFMVRVTRHLAAERGVDQFIDIGTGLPTSPNLHEVAQQAVPAARIIYVDNDPLVLVHARALLTSTPEGRTRYIQADLNDADAIIDSPEVRETFDFSRPVALCLIAVVHFIRDEDALHSIIDRLMKPLPSGSYLTLSTIALDSAPGKLVSEAVAQHNRRGIMSKARTRSQIEKLFTGFRLIEPGVVPVHRWRPDEKARLVNDSMVSMYGGLAVKD